MSDSAMLESLAQLAEDSAAVEIAGEARALAARAAEGRFYVACVGQFKRGKSTLINALVGSSVLPTGVVPVTAIPTVVRYGDPAVRVKQAQGDWLTVDARELADWVTEAGNPSNRKQVAGVEAFVRAPLLATGMCLVDTPGLGSVFATNTGATRDFIPHIDAALVVLGADPPISADELTLVAEVAEQVDHVLFVLNKADRLPAGERQEAAVFTTRILGERLGRPVDRLFEVSALDAFRVDAEPGEWNELVRSLEELAATAGEQLVEAAVTRGVRRLGCRLHRVLAEQRAALLRPVEESERRVQELSALAAEADRVLVELGALLGLDQHRVSLSFGEREEEFLKAAVPTGRSRVRARLTDLSAGARLKRRDALEVANQTARGLLQPWLVTSEQAAETAYREAIGRFTRLARGLLHRVASVAGLDSATLGLEGDDGEAFSAKRGFYFTDLLQRHAPATPWVWIIDAIVPRSLERKRALAAADRYLVDLLRVNAARVRGDLDERLRDSGYRLETQLRVVIHEGRQAAVQALHRARSARSAGEAAVQQELGTIDSRLNQLDAIQPASISDLRLLPSSS
jgi:GTP-binding protein EngB required for normal cell division